MAIDPRITLQAGNIENPLQGLLRGLQTGRENRDRAQLMALRAQQMEAGQEELETLRDERQKQAVLKVMRTVRGYDESARTPQLIEGVAGQLSEIGINMPSPVLEGLLADPSDQRLDAMINGLSGGAVSEREKFDLQTRKIESEIDKTGFKARELGIREKELIVSQDREKRQQNKLSAPSEKALLESQDLVVQAQRNSNEFENLAKDYERLDLSGGLGASVTESFKKLLGTQDDVSEFRRKFNKVRLSEGLRNLPPGPATDRDVQEAFKGVPPENAPAKQVASFLRGAARLARLQAGYNQFKADFISSNNNSKGMNKAWRSSVFSEKLGRDISTAEIYETAQNRGITPEDVMERLGL